ncbi:hypothetical protein LP417_32240 [Polaromonas sp. P1-6]|nr:hypothetical protein LP417_32240 [Polaromonas sp. P1-6]
MLSLFDWRNSSHNWWCFANLLGRSAETWLGNYQYPRSTGAFAGLWTIKALTNMRRGILAILAVCLVGAGADVYWPLHRDLRQFDPVALGTLETTMWQSYYGRQRMALFSELAEMLRTQYQFPWLRSYLGAYRGAAAAFTFKDGKQRSDYQKALPALQAYFGLIRNTGNIDFDAHAPLLSNWSGGLCIGSVIAIPPVRWDWPALKPQRLFIRFLSTRR